MNDDPAFEKALFGFQAIVAFLITEVDHLPMDDRCSEVLVKKLALYETWFASYEPDEQSRELLQKIVLDTKRLQRKISGTPFLFE